MLKKLFSAIKSHKIISGIIIIALGAAGYFIFGTGSKSSVGTTYTYGTATAGTVMQTVSGTGQIEASRQTDITSEVSGDVTGVAVTAGRAVKAGDTIAKIDSSDAQAAIDDAKIALYNAQVSLDNILNPDDSLSITQAKNSVLDAQKTLENDQSGLNDSYQTGFSSVAATFNQLPTIVASLQEIVASANNYVVQSSPTYLDYYYNAVKKYDSTAGSLMTKAASSYQDAKLKYDANFQDYKSASQFSSEANIEALIDETYATSKAVADALKNISSMIQNYESNLKNHNLTPQSFADTQLTNLGNGGFTER